MRRHALGFSGLGKRMLSLWVDSYLGRALRTRGSSRKFFTAIGTDRKRAGSRRAAVRRKRADQRWCTGLSERPGALCPDLAIDNGASASITGRLVGARTSNGHAPVLLVCLP